MPCWRCESTESSLEERVTTWLVDYFLKTHRGVGVHQDCAPDGQVLELGFDLITIITLSLGLLPRETRKDFHGRDDETRDAILQAGLPRLPYVSYLVEALLEAIDALLKRNLSFALSKPSWPIGVSWVVGLSHDVDHLSKWVARNLPLRVGDLKRAVREGDRILGALKSLLATAVGPYLGRRDPYSNVGDVAQIENQKGLAATYFLGVADPGYSPFEITYDPNTLTSSISFASLREMGHEVGLHGSYASGDHRDSLEHEAQQLRELSQSAVVGGRQHYLRFDRTAVSHSLRAGLLYDSSWGYWSKPGFRGGFGSPFQLGPVGVSASNRIVEIPMTIMDTSLREFLHLDPRGAAEAGNALITEASQASGLAVINWHNSAFDREDPRSFGQVFLELLEAVLENHGTIWTLETIARWWHYRDSLQASVDEDRLSVTHPDGLKAVSLRVLGNPSLVPVDEARGARLSTDPRGRRRLTVPTAGLDAVGAAG